tara:strand:- start:2483 stop:2938 length:456 start_codon:yes stop_codon:yes gene_type:complete
VLNYFSLLVFFSLFFQVLNAREIIIIKKDGKNIQYDHDIMRPYLSNDQIALDTEITYAKAIRLQMGGKWKETADLYIKIANRGHPTAQVHLGKQYVHGNGVKRSLVEAYKWFYLSETPIGKHFVKLISEDMTQDEINEAKKLIKNFKPVYD